MAFNAGAIKGDLHLNTKGFQTSIGKVMRMLGVAGLGAGFILAGRKAKQMGSDFGLGMAEINTMLDETTTKMLPELSKGVKQTMVAFGQPLKATQKGLYDILSAGIDASKSLDVLTASAKMATAGVTDIATSTDALTTILNSYSLSAENATDVSDLLFSVVKDGKTTMTELAPSIGMVASISHSAGLSIEDMGSALATMTKSGLRTRIAVTSLKGIISTFLKPSKEAVKVARDLGLELNSTTLKTLGFKGVMEKLAKSTPEQRAKIFDVRALAGFETMIGNTTGYLESYDQMVNRAGATATAFGKIAETDAFKQKKWNETLNVMWITIGTKILPIFTPFIENMTVLIGKLSDGIEGADEFNLSMEDMGGAFKFVMKTGLGTAGVIEALGTSAGLSALAFKILGLQFSSSWKSIKGDTKGATAGFKEINYLTESFSKGMEEGGDRMGVWLDRIKEVDDIDFASELEEISTGVKKVGDEINGLPIRPVDDLITKASTLKGAWLDASTSIESSIMSGLVDTFVDASIAIGDASTSMAEAVGNSMLSMMAAISSALMKSVLETVWAEEIKAVATQITKVIKGIPFPFNLAVVGGAIAGTKALFSGLTSTPKSFAEGGMAIGPQMAMVGDNPAGKEAIIPSELFGKMGGLTVNIKEFAPINIESLSRNNIKEVINMLRQETRKQTPEMVEYVKRQLDLMQKSGGIA